MSDAPAARGTTCRIWFDGFAALEDPNPFRTAGVLEPVAVRMAGAILAVLAPGQNLLCSEATEVSTPGSPERPRHLDRTITISGQKEPGSVATDLCRVVLGYDYMNPRDGDAWTMQLCFRSMVEPPARSFTLSSHSHLNGYRMVFHSPEPADGVRAKVEAVLRRFFGEDRRFYD